MEAVLKSNDGNWTVALKFERDEEYGHDAGVISSFNVVGKHWQDGETHNLSVAVEHLWLRADDIEALRTAVSEWISLPIDQIAGVELVGDFELARLPGQSLRFRFGKRTDTLSHFNPVLSVGYSSGGLVGEFHFVTDQSCLRTFAESLSETLGTLPPNKSLNSTTPAARAPADAANRRAG